MDFNVLKRKQLQELCKKHGIPANLKNVDMAQRLSSLLSEEEKHEKKAMQGKSCLKNVSEVDEVDEVGECENVVIISKEAKKVRFSPENQTFLFERTDPRAMRLLARKKRALVHSREKVNRSVISGISEDCESVVQILKPARKRALRRRTVVSSEVDGLVRETNEDVSELILKRGELGRNSRSQRGKSIDPSAEVVSLLSSGGIDQVKNALQKGNLRRNTRSVAHVKDLGLDTDIVDNADNLNLNLRSRRGKANQDSVEVISLLSPGGINKVRKVVTEGDLRRNTRRSAVQAKDMGLDSENDDKLILNLRTRRGKTNQDSVMLVPMSSPGGGDTVNKPVDGENLKRSLRSQGGREMENDEGVASLMSPCKKRNAKRGKKAKGSMDEGGGEAVDPLQDEMVDHGEINVRITRRQLRSREVRADVSGEEIVEVTGEGIDRPQDELIDCGKNNGRVTRKQLSSREVTSEVLGCKNPEKRGRPRKSVRLAEDVKEINQSPISKEQEYNTIQAGDVIGSLAQRSPEIILESKGRKRGRRKTLMVKRHDFLSGTELVAEKSEEVINMDDNEIRESATISGGLCKRSRRDHKDGGVRVQEIRRSARRAAKINVDFSSSDKVLHHDEHINHTIEDDYEMVDQQDISQGWDGIGDSSKKPNDIAADHIANDEIIPGDFAPASILPESRQPEVNEENQETSREHETSNFDEAVAQSCCGALQQLQGTCDTPVYEKVKGVIVEAPENEEIIVQVPVTDDSSTPLLQNNSDGGASKDAIEATMTESCKNNYADEEQSIRSLNGLRGRIIASATSESNQVIELNTEIMQSIKEASHPEECSSVSKKDASAMGDKVQVVDGGDIQIVNDKDEFDHTMVAQPSMQAWEGNMCNVEKSDTDETDHIAISDIVLHDSTPNNSLSESTTLKVKGLSHGDQSSIPGDQEIITLEEATCGSTIKSTMLEANDSVGVCEEQAPSSLSNLEIMRESEAFKNDGVPELQHYEMNEQSKEEEGFEKLTSLSMHNTIGTKKLDVSACIVEKLDVQLTKHEGLTGACNSIFKEADQSIPEISIEPVKRREKSCSEASEVKHPCFANYSKIDILVENEKSTLQQLGQAKESSHLEDDLNNSTEAGKYQATRGAFSVEQNPKFSSEPIAVSSSSSPQLYVVHDMMQLEDFSKGKRGKEAPENAEENVHTLANDVGAKDVHENFQEQNVSLPAIKEGPTLRPTEPPYDNPYNIKYFDYCLQHLFSEDDLLNTNESKGLGSKVDDILNTNEDLQGTHSITQLGEPKVDASLKWQVVDDNDRQNTDDMDMVGDQVAFQSLNEELEARKHSTENPNTISAACVMELAKEEIIKYVAQPTPCSSQPLNLVDNMIHSEESDVEMETEKNSMTSANDDGSTPFSMQKSHHDVKFEEENVSAPLIIVAGTLNDSFSTSLSGQNCLGECSEDLNAEEKQLTSSLSESKARMSICRTFENTVGKVQSPDSENKIGCKMLDSNVRLVDWEELARSITSLSEEKSDVVGEVGVEGRVKSPSVVENLTPPKVYPEMFRKSLEEGDDIRTLQDGVSYGRSKKAVSVSDLSEQTLYLQTKVVGSCDTMERDDGFCRETKGDVAYSEKCSMVEHLAYVDKSSIKQADEANSSVRPNVQHSNFDDNLLSFIHVRGLEYEKASEVTEGNDTPLLRSIGEVGINNVPEIFQEQNLTTSPNISKESLSLEPIDTKYDNSTSEQLVKAEDMKDFEYSLQHLFSEDDIFNNGGREGLVPKRDDGAENLRDTCPIRQAIESKFDTKLRDVMDVMDVHNDLMTIQVLNDEFEARRCSMEKANSISAACVLTEHLKANSIAESTQLPPCISLPLNVAYNMRQSEECSEKMDAESHSLSSANDDGSKSPIMQKSDDGDEVPGENVSASPIIVEVVTSMTNQSCSEPILLPLNSEPSVFSGSMENDEEIVREPTSGDSFCSINVSKMDQLEFIDKSAIKQVEEVKNFIKPNVEHLVFEDSLMSSGQERVQESEKALRLTEGNMFTLSDDGGQSVTSQDGKLNELLSNHSSDDSRADLNCSIMGNIEKDMSQMIRAQQETNHTVVKVFDSQFPQATDCWKHGQDDKGNMVEFEPENIVTWHSTTEMHNETTLEASLNAMDASITSQNQIELSTGYDVQGNCVIGVAETNENVCLDKEGSCSFMDSEKRAGKNEELFGLALEKKDSKNLKACNQGEMRNFTQSIVVLHETASLEDENVNELCVEGDNVFTGGSSVKEQITDEDFTSEKAIITGDDLTLEGMEISSASLCIDGGDGIGSACQHVNLGEGASAANKDAEELGCRKGASIRRDAVREDDGDATDHVDANLLLKRRNRRSVLIHGTPIKPVLPRNEMKESMTVPKRLHMVNATLTKPRLKRKALDDKDAQKVEVFDAADEKPLLKRNRSESIHGTPRKPQLPVSEMKEKVTATKRHYMVKAPPTKYGVERNAGDVRDPQTVQASDAAVEKMMFKNRNRSILIHGTPAKPVLPVNVMKNTVAPKRSQMVHATATKPGLKGKALGNVWK